MNQTIEIRPEVLQHMKDYAKKCKHPEAPFTMVGDLELSLLDMIGHVEKRTELGIESYRVWEGMYEDIKRTSGQNR